MLASINRVFEHDGRAYHLHCEDLGREEGAFEVRILANGGILWQRRVAYGELRDRQLSRHDFEQELRQQMEKTVQTVQAAIVKGRLP